MIDIHEIISEIQNSQCCSCKFGKALIALRDLAELEPQGVSVHKAPRKSQPRKQQERKAARPVEHKKHARHDGTASAILEYIWAHPGCTSKEIAQELGIPKVTVGYHLTRLKKAGELELTGARTNATWSLAGSGGAPSRVVEDEDDEPKTAECKICGHVSSSKERLIHHMTVVHKATT